METKITVMDIVIENSNSVEAVSDIIHEYRQYVIGRMGLPYRLKGITIISIALEAMKDTVTEISRRISEIEGAGVRTYYLGTLQKPE
ncbi:MAG: hypothetical protein IJ697_03235 [Synergistaceae bacterium]|nr:hypothetical protein [Synergistaceae bacterium]MBR1657460.1 hypothetical protein [Synergistaceae bacterium]